MCTNSFNNPDEFVEMRNVLVEQGLMPENEFHRISCSTVAMAIEAEMVYQYRDEDLLRVKINDAIARSDLLDLDWRRDYGEI